MRSQRKGKCLFCEKTFTNLSRHLLTHTQEKPFFCGVCPKEFSETSSKIRHERIHTGERPFTCDVCQKCFRQESTLAQHKRTHLDDRDYGCSYCEESFKLQLTLYSHITAKHTMEKSYECTLCSSTFTTSAGLAQHKKTHQKEKPFKCLKCSKSFKRKGDLSTHLYVHMEVPYRFSSDVCSSKFTQKSSLNTHKKLVHMNVEDREHSCELCGKKFAINSCLVSHIRTHTLERPYKCSFCIKRFSQSNNLQLHLCSVHLREKPHICALCAKEFGRSSGLKRHINDDEFPFAAVNINLICYVHGGIQDDIMLRFKIQKMQSRLSDLEMAYKAITDVCTKLEHLTSSLSIAAENKHDTSKSAATNEPAKQKSYAGVSKQLLRLDTLTASTPLSSTVNSSTPTGEQDHMEYSKQNAKENQWQIQKRRKKSRPPTEGSAVTTLLACSDVRPVRFFVTRCKSGTTRTND